MTKRRKLLLDDTVLPAGLTLEEEREACRALKGAMLRQEVYALDGSEEKQAHPYVVTEQNFTIRMLQPQATNPYAVFFTHPREAITYQYERNPEDPRIGHTLTLEVDDFGNVLKSAAVGYGRRRPDTSLSQTDQAKQAELLVTYTENAFTNSIDNDDAYRTPLPAETRTYEITAFKPENNAARFSFEELTRNNFSLLASAVEIPYEQTADSVVKQKRLIEHVRTLYRPDDLGLIAKRSAGAFAAGPVESLAVAGESYKLALTPGLIAKAYGGKVTDADAGRAKAGMCTARGTRTGGSVQGVLSFRPTQMTRPAAELELRQSSLLFAAADSRSISSRGFRNRKRG